MINPYPFKFRPILKEKIWGGQKIKTELNKDFIPYENCGETWEISGIPGNISIVSEGPLTGTTLPQLIDTYRGQLVGEAVYRKEGNKFPLLVKFIDANQDLSIQVHPNDELAQKRHQSLGKTEMWYIFQSDPASRLVVGFNQPLSREKYLEYFNSGRLMEVLNQEEVESDDVFFVPAGRVHTIGKGILLAEIQQTSDVTYRIYDFDRVDKNGNSRELHTEEALDALDFQHYPQYKTDYDRSANNAVPIVRSTYFEVNRLYFDHETTRNYEHLDSFVIYVCVDGKSRLSWDGQHITLMKGEAALIPASIKEIKLTPAPSIKLLETYIP
ncbi:MAG: mannose-6-phosphate isomerase [Cyclobacteriaceae bacterium]|nr:MAG: mannose-6-phosphate isomerase [Cyclobacteriaceae bacterium]